MIQTIRNAWKVAELRNKLIFVVFALLIFRLGSAIPVPFVNTDALSEYMNAQSATIFGLINVMSGDAFSQATLFALGIQPYINASIIIQLLCIAIPALERLAKEGGEEGKKKIERITRYSTVGIALIQAYGYFTLIKSYGVVANTSVWAAIVIVLAFVAGSSFVMWLGEQITEFGIGNGISTILFAGIISRFPNAIQRMIAGVKNWANGLSAADGALVLHPAFIPVILIGIVAMVAFVVYITNAERRIPVQYAKRVVGRKMYGGQSSHIPMKVNMSGVLPVIFAQSIASIPATIGMFFPDPEQGSFWYGFMNLFSPNNLFYIFLELILIVAFSYFYLAISFNPVEVANNLKKNGGFIPGLRPGKPTSDFISASLKKITLIGAFFLAVIAVLPMVVNAIAVVIAPGISLGAVSFGGTSMLIVVGVVLETVRDLESQITMRHYKGFLG